MSLYLFFAYIQYTVLRFNLFNFFKINVRKNATLPVFLEDSYSFVRKTKLNINTSSETIMALQVMPERIS
jgi:hypothetical protein